MNKTIRNLGMVLSLGAVIALTGCAGDRYRRSTGQTMDDAGITARVKSELLADPQVRGLAVDVDTFRGQVQLNGFVNTPEEKQRAEQIARNVDGVQMVRNNLMLKPEPAGAEPRQRNQRDVEAEVEINNREFEAEIDRR